MKQDKKKKFGGMNFILILYLCFFLY